MRAPYVWPTVPPVGVWKLNSSHVVPQFIPYFAAKLGVKFPVICFT